MHTHCSKRHPGHRVVSAEESSRRHGPPTPIEFLESRMYLVAGQLDLSFGNLGQASQSIQANLRAQADSIARQADGKILVAGHASMTWVPYYSVARYTAAGQLDTTFGTGGRVRITGVILPVDHPVIVMVQKSGRILLAAGNPNDFRVYALRPDGATDRSFGNSGLLVIRPPYPTSVIQRTAVLLPDQSIMLGGIADAYSPQTRGAWLHITRDGAIDPAYNKTMRLLPAGLGSTDIRKLTPLADGSVIAAGSIASDALLLKLSASGQIVPNFGSADGLARIDLGATDTESGDALALLPGGDIVLAGSADNRFALARVTSAGQLVKTFGTQGIVHSSISDEGRAATINLAADGRLLVAGAGSILAFTQAGKSDTTYAKNGVAAVDFGPAADTANDAITASAGTLLVAGRAADRASANDITHFGLERLTSSGALDATFAAGTVTPGRLTTAFPAPADVTTTRMARQSDGKIITFSTWQLMDYGVEFSRLNADGSLDTSFGDGGHTRVRLNFPYAAGSDVLIDSKGRILAATHVQLGEQHVQVIRLLASGKLDTSIGNGGILPVDLGSAPESGASIALTPGDGFVVGAGGETTFNIARFDSTGHIITSFGSAGRSTIKIPTAQSGRYASLNRILLLPDGKFLAVGEAPIANARGTGYSHSAFATVRLTANGAADSTFGGGGVVVTSFDSAPDSIEQAHAAAVLPDGRVLVVGQSWGRTASTVNPFQIAAVLYRANGTLDSSFHGNGKLLIHYRPGANDNGAAVIRQSDGKFLISGASWFSTADPPVEAAIRLTPDGKLDPTFADHGTLLLTTSSPFSSGATDLIAQPDGRSLLSAGFNGTASVWRLLDDAAPAPSAAISGGALIITGSASPDLIRVVRSGNTVQLTGFPVSFPTTAFSRIAITGLGGNDRIDASNIDLPLTIDGGDGNDVILGGAGAETLTGGAGDDTIFGGKGNDLIHGGDGNDYLSAGPGSNTLFGDAGNDQIFALNTTLDRIDGGAGFDREKGDASDLLTSIEGLLA